MEFEIWFKEKVQTVENALNIYFEKHDNKQRIIYDAMEYSLFAGGKRLRPVLMLSVYEMFKEINDTVLAFSCAMEMIHTYSLIHDDLPAMDDDDYRRGRLSNHKKFGEATAILAGDGLLNMAFETMLKESIKSQISKNVLLECMLKIATSSGSEGMIGGQVVDMFSTENTKTTEDLEYLQNRKTGAIIKSSCVVGAMLAGATEKEIEAIEVFAEKIGLAFQVKDDILDVEGNEEKLGKPIGSDKEKDKVTYVTILGLEKSKELLGKLTDEAIESIASFGERANMLIELAKYLIIREN